MPELTHQIVGFHFKVVFKGKEDGLDTRFQSVSGLDVQLETEPLKEGGENQFEHALPLRRKFSDLVLKRGIVSISQPSEMTRWFKMAFESPELGLKHFIQPVDLSIVLLSDLNEPLISWEVIHAFPKTWRIAELNAERSEVLIETMELHYNHFRFV